MSRDKQIEEMCGIMVDASYAACEDTPLVPESAGICDKVDCHRCKQTRRLMSAGYRKTSEVVSEIIDEIFKILDAEYRQYDTESLNDTLNKMYMSSRNTVIKITAELVELKNKYTESEDTEEGK